MEQPHGKQHHWIIKKTRLVLVKENFHNTGNSITESPWKPDWSLSKRTSITLETTSLNHHESHVGPYERDLPNRNLKPISGNSITESPWKPDWSLWKRSSNHCKRQWIITHARLVLIKEIFQTKTLQAVHCAWHPEKTAMYASCKLTCAKGGHTKSSDQHFLLPGTNYLETILCFCHATFVCVITTTYLQKPGWCAGWAGHSPESPVGSLAWCLYSEVYQWPPTFKSQADVQGELDAVHGYLSDLWHGVCAARYTSNHLPSKARLMRRVSWMQSMATCRISGMGSVQRGITVPRKGPTISSLSGFWAKQDHQIFTFRIQTHKEVQKNQKNLQQGWLLAF